MLAMVHLVMRCAVLCCLLCGVQILGVHLGRRGLPLAPDVQVEEIAAMTMGFTGADLANLVNEVCAEICWGRGNISGVPRQVGCWRSF